MKRFKAESGAVSFGLVFGILFVIFLIYEAMQFGPLLLAQYQFQDSVNQAAKFSHMKKPETIQNELVKIAGELALPISRDMIKVNRMPTSTRIQVHYELSAEWAPGRTYKWTVQVDEESMLY